MYSNTGEHPVEIHAPVTPAPHAATQAVTFNIVDVETDCHEN